VPAEVGRPWVGLEGGARGWVAPGGLWWGSRWGSNWRVSEWNERTEMGRDARDGGGRLGRARIVGILMEMNDGPMTTCSFRG